MLQEAEVFSKYSEKEKQQISSYAHKLWPFAHEYYAVKDSEDSVKTKAAYNAFFNAYKTLKDKNEEEHN